MTTSEERKYKADFIQALKSFSESLTAYVSTDRGDWTLKGFIDIYKNIYTISSDTKIVSKILEIHIFPQILLFADQVGYKIILAEKQNWYPDLTFINKKNEEVKFAVDIKTTYRKSQSNRNAAGFTLGSHGKYFKDRQSAKNIQFPYSQYLGHYVLGAIYTRTDFSDLDDALIYQARELREPGDMPIRKIGEREVTIVANLKSITSVIKDFEFFAAEKWKIASDGQGSGNTANIGSITDIEDLRNEHGIFANLGEEWYDEYWMNYGAATMVKGGKSVKITKLADFLEFKGRTDLQKRVVVRRKRSIER